MDQKEIKELQKKESKIWAELNDVCEEETLISIQELIEINITLEAECGQ